MKTIILTERECVVLYDYLCAIENNIQECQWEVEPRDPDYEVMSQKYKGDRNVIRSLRRMLEVIRDDHTI